MGTIAKAIPPQIVVYIVSLLISTVAGKFLIPLLRRLKFGQVIRKEGPQSHKSKTGTPTMGGVIFLLPVLIMGIIFSFKDARILIPVLVTLGFALIGFSDDYLKIIKKHNEGLTPKQKMISLLIVSGAFTWYATTFVSEANTLILPFLGFEKPINLPVLLSIPFNIFVLAAFTNAVNLTDGLDGLAGSVTTIVLLFYSIICIRNSEWDYIRIFCAILAGGILGFLVYNLYPAKVFMGDTGSLALGGAIAAISILTGTTVILAITGIIYVFETLSVIIQVIYFKRTGKRVFLMAPLHHHFEHKGWSETKVVSIFTFITVLTALLALLILR
ncbi:MAG: phospho-N-acetylmuramoyl-pentapeptide-transferase [Clostridiaceae bacterium]|nr:phospho-N-acetylmuramoyl-pentapeptide-transferase [Clostridiaceae bacterium]